LAKLADPQAVYTQSGHLSTIYRIRHRSRQVCRPKTDVLTTGPRWRLQRNSI